MTLFEEIDQLEVMRRELKARIVSARKRDIAIARVIERAPAGSNVDAHHTERAELRTVIDNSLEELVRVESRLRILRHTPIPGRFS